MLGLAGARGEAAAEGVQPLEPASPVGRQPRPDPTLQEALLDTAPESDCALASGSRIITSAGSVSTMLDTDTGEPTSPTPHAFLIFLDPVAVPVKFPAHRNGAKAQAFCLVTFEPSLHRYMQAHFCREACILTGAAFSQGWAGMLQPSMPAHQGRHGCRAVRGCASDE